MSLLYHKSKLAVKKIILFQGSFHKGKIEFPFRDILKSIYRRKKGIRETATKLGCLFLLSIFIGENQLTISVTQPPMIRQQGVL